MGGAPGTQVQNLLEGTRNIREFSHFRADALSSLFSLIDKSANGQASKSEINVIGRPWARVCRYSASGHVFVGKAR